MKKIFYALRPAAALRWLRLHPDRVLAPMHFPTLMAECNPPPEVAALTTDLITRKAVTREMGVGALPESLGKFIDDALAVDEGGETATRHSPLAAEAADRLFSWVTLRLGEHKVA